jgi:hypothetical protein
MSSWIFGGISKVVPSFQDPGKIPFSGFPEGAAGNGGCFFLEG